MSDAKHLRSFVERIENIEAEIKGLNTDKRDIYAEAKTAGFDPQAVKDVVAYRRDPDKAETRSSRCDEYVALLGNGLPQNNEPTRNSEAMRAIVERPSRVRAHEEPKPDDDLSIPPSLRRESAPTH